MRHTITLAALLLSLTVIAVAQNPPVKFEVASRKLVKNGECQTRYQITPNGINYCNANLSAVIALAYQFSVTRILPPAKPSYDKSVLDEDVEIVANADHPATKEQISVMLQRLLADRIKLAVHREMRPETVYHPRSSSAVSKAINQVLHSQHVAIAQSSNVLPHRVDLVIGLA